MFEERNKLVLKRNLDIDDATLSSYIMEKYDTIKALETLAFNVETKSDLKERILNIFKEDAKGVCLSTIHKSKGLEAENVFILCHSSMPSKNCHHEWEKYKKRTLCMLLIQGRKSYWDLFRKEKYHQPAVCRSLKI